MKTSNICLVISFSILALDIIYDKKSITPHIYFAASLVCICVESQMRNQAKGGDTKTTY